MDSDSEKDLSHGRRPPVTINGQETHLVDPVRPQMFAGHRLHHTSRKIAIESKVPQSPGEAYSQHCPKASLRSSLNS